MNSTSHKYNHDSIKVDLDSSKKQLCLRTGPEIKSELGKAKVGGDGKVGGGGGLSSYRFFFSLTQLCPCLLGFPLIMKKKERKKDK